MNVSVRKVFWNHSAVDLSAKDGYAVKFDTDGIALCTAIADEAMGVITRGGLTSSEVCIFGECPAKTGGAIVAGNFLTPHTDSTVVVTAASSSEFALALETAVSGCFSNIFVYGAANLRT
jgi:hypothetical protein